MNIAKSFGGKTKIRVAFISPRWRLAAVVPHMNCSPPAGQTAVKRSSRSLLRMKQVYKDKQRSAHWSEARGKNALGPAHKPLVVFLVGVESTRPCPAVGNHRAPLGGGCCGRASVAAGQPPVVKPRGPCMPGISGPR